MCHNLLVVVHTVMNMLQMTLLQNLRIITMHLLRL